MSEKGTRGESVFMDWDSLVHWYLIFSMPHLLWPGLLVLVKL